MITNTDVRSFDVIEITNEMPWNRIGGVGTVIENLIAGLETLGTRALWFLVDHSYRPLEVERILARYPSVAVGGHDDLTNFDAPVAHLHSYNVNAGLLQALTDTKVIYTVHSLLVEEERSNDVDLHGAVRWQETLIAQCDEVVLVSEAERAHYRTLGYERLNPRVTVVPNGLAPPPRFRPRTRRRTLGFCGRLVPRKHPEYVQMILREPGFERARTLVAGKGFSTYARDLVGRLALEDRVAYLGWCGGSRLEAFFEAIDVLALPSTYEPFGMVALEAAARGIPVVCTRVDGLVEVLGEHAFYCEGDSYAEFRAAMRRWAEADDATAAAVAEGARRRYRRRFSEVRMARRYRRRFDKLAGARAPAACPDSREVLS
jgi:glycosyltransferase involved in cell wall biosynthesis